MLGKPEGKEDRDKKAWISPGSGATGGANGWAGPDGGPGQRPQSLPTLILVRESRHVDSICLSL